MSEERSLEEIEEDYWGDPPAGATRLVATVHGLRRRPVGSLDTEDLRVLIGQKVGLGALLPLALDRLEEDPLAEGDFYPGDLLVAVLRVPRDYWAGHPEQHVRVNGVVERLGAGDLDDTLRDDITAFRA
ncbi:hypothetical protein HH310_12790 [Actinoplanes sp. TBRC 11911]|uniref:contact-dependent growth inhibition system immunity protein n=1 Tax=Actinoplanes sp. TBRC 11911 TaxID=2729386 RepID=UPI00145E4606|nr:contact-dependent growth inhibition system immunity protein [Actinoplanes sp. TBRC 11911]NMO52071.1 hypothetical protein [Actinoplanes sp. TBRC 11911]